VGTRRALRPWLAPRQVADSDRRGGLATRVLAWATGNFERRRPTRTTDSRTQQTAAADGADRSGEPSRSPSRPGAQPSWW
jgi:hypothetical protein